MEMAAVKQQTQPSSAGAGPAPMLKKGTVAGSITTTATAVSLAAYPHGGAFHPYTKPLDGAPTNLQPRLSAVIPLPQFTNYLSHFDDFFFSPHPSIIPGPSSLVDPSSFLYSYLSKSHFFFDQPQPLI
jgi:hypothetical protein